MLPGVGPRAAFLGTMDGDVPVPLGWADDVTENPGLGDSEIWELFNTTEDAHPIHVHLVQFEVLDRTAPGQPARRRSTRPGARPP